MPTIRSSHKQIEHGNTYSVLVLITGQETESSFGFLIECAAREIPKTYQND